MRPAPAPRLIDKVMRCGVNFTRSRFYGNLPKTQIDLNRSTSAKASYRQSIIDLWIVARRDARISRDIGSLERWRSVSESTDFDLES